MESNGDDFYIFYSIIVEGSLAKMTNDIFDLRIFLNSISLKCCNFSMFFFAGIKNVIDACRQCKVKQLIYNGPADVVYASARHIHNGDESLPYDGRVSISHQQF